MILVLGSVVAADGDFDAVLALSQAHVVRSRTEPGCISHAVYADTEHPNRLVFVEQWRDQASLRQHFLVPASRAFIESLASLAAEPPSLAVYEANELKSD
jgi:quinol monooxygenase YgiN